MMSNEKMRNLINTLDQIAEGQPAFEAKPFEVLRADTKGKAVSDKKRTTLMGKPSTNKKPK